MHFVFPTLPDREPLPLPEGSFDLVRDIWPRVFVGVTLRIDHLADRRAPARLSVVAHPELRFRANKTLDQLPEFVDRELLESAMRPRLPSFLDSFREGVETASALRLAEGIYIAGATLEITRVHVDQIDSMSMSFRELGRRLFDALSDPARRAPAPP